MSTISDAGNTDRMLGATRSYDAVFTDRKENAVVKPSDFLNIMIAQMRNQDFLNPMDDTQFVTQMAQFSTMQQMMELAEYSKTNYAMSLVGQTVTAARFNVSGGLDSTTGVVQKISLVDNEYLLTIGDNRYTLAQVMEIHAGAASKEVDEDKAGETTAAAAAPETDTKTNTGKACVVDPSSFAVEAGEPTTDAAVIAWKVATDDQITAMNLTYTVYYSTEGPFDTLEAVKKGMISGQPYRAGINVDTIVGLDADTEYYINVVVRDIFGGEAVYQPVAIATKAVENTETKPVTEPGTEAEGAEGAELEEGAEAELGLEAGQDIEAGLGAEEAQGEAEAEPGAEEVGEP